MVILYVWRACSNRVSNSCSNSSSVQRVNGFFAPPSSTFFDTSRQRVSNIRLRALPPGGLSQYCFTMMLANPDTPPKYCITRSITSAECGILLPPDTTLSVYRSTPAASILRSAADRFFASFLAAALAATLAQLLQTLDQPLLPSRW